MAYDQYVGTGNIRTNVYDKIIRNIAQRSYKFKQAVSVVPTSAWNNYFYREDPTVSTASGNGNTVKGVPRGAAFPQAVVAWDRISTIISKYGLEDFIHWEDIMTDDVDVRDRTLMKIAEGVVKAVDDEIFRALGGTATIADISSFSIVQREWNVSSAAIMDDLQRARQLIAESNISTDNLMLFVSPKDYRSIMNYIYDKGAQAPKMGEIIGQNGNMGNFGGFELIVSNSVTASNALVVVPKICGSWKELVPLQTSTDEDKFKGVRVRAVEMGTCQLHQPKAVVLIVGTQRT